MNSRDGVPKKLGRPSINIAINPGNANVTTNSASGIGNIAGANSTLNGMESTTGDYVPIFFEEISQIMRGYGDCEKPLRESVILVEKIVLHQLRGIMQDAIDHAMSRQNSPVLSRRDFEYIMRKNPVRVARLQKYFRDMAFVKKKMKDLYGDRFSQLGDLGSNLDESDEDSDRDVVEKFDEEKVRRLFRADRISQILAGKQYEEFNLARRTSFMHRNTNTMKNRMRAWLNFPEDVIISQSCLLTLSYLAHETIAVLVDFCILTRLNSSNRAVEPYSRVTSSGTSHSMLHLCPEVTHGRGVDGVKAITPQEIHEAMRRHRQMATQGMGHFRNNALNCRSPYLAM
ncbi:uncharacterized protein LOC131436572 [Malaya genurostris]|uniref:uncharacterized protein LOC131436572 n=1 Tax=Malaya genurostris TaxID=325434 RepID=UPI0026F3DFDF|nr:uncharacterized protein LOC131436572 [Malaya genurostris]